MKAFFGLVKERLECVAVHSGADLCLLRNRNNISYIGLFRFLPSSEASMPNNSSPTTQYRAFTFRLSGFLGVLIHKRS